MATIIVNGIKIETNGGNVTAINGKVIVDGVEIKLDNVQDVHIKGDVNNVRCSGSAEIDGKVAGNVDAGGSVTCGDVGGEVDAGGSVTANNIKGDIDAGGSVHVRK